MASFNRFLTVAALKWELRGDREEAVPLGEMAIVGLSGIR